MKTSSPRHLFDRALSGQIEFVELQCDSGMVQIDSLNVDTSESVRQAKSFQKELPRIAAGEGSYLRQRRAQLVVGDIPPLAFAAAAAAGIPSIAVGNFTWDWIYEGYPEESPFELSQQIRGLYREATKVLKLPMAGGFAGLDAITTGIPFIARESLRQRDEVRAALGLSPRADGTPLILMSFGGYGIEGLDTAAVGALPGYTVATTDLPTRDHAIAPARGLLYLSERQLDAAGIRYPDLVRAADIVVTKPGYGIISEAIANDAALLYTSRGRFPEYDVLVAEMPRYLRAQFIEQRDLLSGHWAPSLEKLLSQPAPPEKPALNGAEVVVDEILNLVGLRG